MVPLDRALVSSYRLSIVTMSLSAAVWPQFATKVYLGALLEVYVISQVTQVATTFTFAGLRAQTGTVGFP